MASKTNVDCKVIGDLMAIYAAGEASPETARFVEAHLEECPDCKAALEAARRGEHLLAELDSIEKPFKFDGRKVLIRTQRIFFGVLFAFLLLGILVLATLERLVVQGFLDISLPRPFPPGGNAINLQWAIAGVVFLVLFGLFQAWRMGKAGEWRNRSYVTLVGIILLFGVGLVAYRTIVLFGFLGAAIVGTLLFAVYIFMLWWRAKQDAERGMRRFLLSVEVAMPLLFLVLATLFQISAGDSVAAWFCALLLVAALAFTVAKLPGLPHLTGLALLILLVGTVFLVGNVVMGVFNMFDYSFDKPSALGQPADDTAIDTVCQVDLEPLSLIRQGQDTATEVYGFALPDGAGACRSTYANDAGNDVTVTMIRFDHPGEARDFFYTWRMVTAIGFYDFDVDYTSSVDEPYLDSDSPFDIHLYLPGVLLGEDGQIGRSYNEDILTAYNGWQTENWVTIVEVRGGLRQSLQLARMVKERISFIYWR